MPQLDISTWPSQIFWLAITFFCLYLVISRIAVPRTGGVIERRKSTIAGDLAEAQHLKEQVDATVQGYEAALAEARARANAFVQSNRAALNDQIDAERAKLDGELGAKTAAAEKTIAAAKAKALEGIDGVAAEIAADIVAELAGTKVTKLAAAAAVAKIAK